ncbi:hypothetical protein ACFYNO_02015 [Kitasatospora sp. NPDC006697]|uniref:hypothetical protein n=1 Tax=Kitasatospora sp. NPDC006697 TaxID=3364020 RepID=UPI0036833939
MPAAVRATSLLLAAVLLAWSAAALGALALYVRLISDIRATVNGEGQFAGLLWLTLLSPGLLAITVQLALWLRAAASWRKQRTDATERIKVATVLTALSPVLLAIAPAWAIPYRTHLLIALATLAALALATAWTAHRPAARAHLTERPRRIPRYVPTHHPTA